MMKRFLVFLTVVGIVLAACSTPAGPVVPTEIVPTPTPTEPAPSAEAAQQAAIKALAAALGLSVDQITVVSSEAVEWTDSCLGIVRIDATCLVGPVPGFRVVLAAQGHTYEYHTNADGSVAEPVAPPEAAAAIEAARRALAEALGIAVEEVVISSARAVEWPNACLGVERPGFGCAEVITPGFFIVLEANGQSYEFHANQDGSALVLGGRALTWTRQGGIAGFCDELAIFRSGEAQALTCQAAPADGAIDLEALTDAERAQLDEWLAKFGPVTIEQSDGAVADSMTVTLALMGTGTEQPSADEQQAMLLWAQDVFTRLNQ